VFATAYVVAPAKFIQFHPLTRQGHDPIPQQQTEARSSATVAHRR
jgi:putative component of membrane protein insertase Oxa1/YidC/SpoIIIJ protein YidD